MRASTLAPWLLSAVCLAVTLATVTAPAPVASGAPAPVVMAATVSAAPQQRVEICDTSPVAEAAPAQPDSEVEPALPPLSQVDFDQLERGLDLVDELAEVGVATPLDEVVFVQLVADLHPELQMDLLSAYYGAINEGRFRPGMPGE